MKDRTWLYEPAVRQGQVLLAFQTKGVPRSSANRMFRQEGQQDSFCPSPRAGALDQEGPRRCGRPPDDNAAERRSDAGTHIAPTPHPPPAGVGQSGHAS